jgi:hypothetical protein
MKQPFHYARMFAALRRVIHAFRTHQLPTEHDFRQSVRLMLECIDVLRDQQHIVVQAGVWYERLTNLIAEYNELVAAIQALGLDVYSKPSADGAIVWFYRWNGDEARGGYPTYSAAVSAALRERLPNSPA